jgi:hypothetical protein
MEWLRWWHGTVEDPKFTLIARKSGQPRCVVLAVWQYLLEHASQNEPRGCLDGIDEEIIGVVLDVEPDAVIAVLDALETRQMIVDGMIARWMERQPQREENLDYGAKSSTERSRLYRKRKRTEQNESSQTATTCNAPATTCNAPATQEDKDKDLDTEGDEEEDEEEEISNPNPKGDINPPGHCAKNAQCPGRENEKTDLPISPAKKKTDPLDGFEEFWAAWPRKVSKREAEKAWTKIHPDERIRGLITTAVKLATTQEQWTRDGGRYIPHAATWLNQRRWEDEIAVPSQTPLARASPHATSRLERESRAAVEQAKAQFRARQGFDENALTGECRRVDG